MRCVSPLKGWKNSETGGIQFRADGAREKMEVACGQCISCRLNGACMWAVRIVHESSLHETTGGNCFVTLTYRDPRECDADQLRNGHHIPLDWSLHKKHWQDFMKRLRKFFAPQKIRFFMCGEYGHRCKHSIDLDSVGCPLCRCGRPHYHAILFNCSFPDLESYGSHNGELRYTSPSLERIWQYGFVDVGAVTPESAAYVARYSLKKRTGVLADDHYMSYDLDGVVTFITPEFCLMSRGHTCKEHRGMPYQRDCDKCSRGIGHDWYLDYSGDVFPADETPVVGKSPVKMVPRYYEELFKISDPLTLEEIKAVRRKFHEAHADDYSPERLLDAYKVQKANLELFQKRRL